MAKKSNHLNALVGICDVVNLLDVIILKKNNQDEIRYRLSCINQFFRAFKATNCCNIVSATIFKLTMLPCFHATKLKLKSTIADKWARYLKAF